MSEEAPPRTTQSKSAYSPFSSLPAASKSSSPVITPLTIPGHVPDLVVADMEKGTLCQVYYKGTPQEISITQRVLPRDGGNMQVKSQATIMAEASASKSVHINTVRVTIEGRRTRQELLQLAKSITP